MSENFQDVIIEDIKDLIEDKGCYFCFKKVEYPNLGGFKTGEDNPLELQNPICNPCWLKCDIWNQECFRSLNCVLKDSQGELTEKVEITSPVAVDINDDFDNLSQQLNKTRQCDHTYRPVKYRDNILACQKCNKEVNIAG